MTRTSLYWTTTTIYVDLETGEQINKKTKELTKQEIKNKYTIIKTKKYVTTTVSTGHITYTIECRRKPEQGELKLG